MNALPEEERSWAALNALVGLINNKNIHRRRNKLKILKVSKEQYDLIINSGYDRLTRDEILQATVNAIMYFWLRDRNVRN